MVRVDILALRRVFADGTSIGPIDLSIADGEFVTLLGPSGAGKTTTLRMIAGFITPDSGDLLFDGQSVLSIPPRERNIGMVFQSTALFPHMTVFQNISFSLDMAGWQHKDVVARVEELASMLRIKRLLRRRVDQISGGEAQRVALARALARDPKLLLLDEPLSALDPELRERLQVEIRRIQRRLNVTTIYVTHSQEEAFAISDRIAILRDGIIVQVGDPEDIYEHPADEFVARFLGGGNVFRGTVVGSSDGTIRVSVGSAVFSVAGEAEEGEVVAFSVKPEDVVVSLEKQDGEMLQARVRSVVPQLGSYRVTLQLDAQQVVAIVRDSSLARSLRSSGDNPVWFGFAPSDAVVIPPSRPHTSTC